MGSEFARLPVEKIIHKQTMFY